MDPEAWNMYKKRFLNGQSPPLQYTIFQVENGTSLKTNMANFPAGHVGFRGGTV